MASLVDSVEKLRVGLDYHLARHDLLVSNLAQSETPGYKPVDLARSGDSFQAALSTALAAPDGGQGIAAAANTPGSSSPQFNVVDDMTMASADGNGVDAEKVGAKIATNQIRYDVVAQLTSGELQDLIWAANDGRNG